MPETAKRLHLVIYSDLNPTGGGRETWLQNFLPALLSAQVFEGIKLYTLPAESKAAKDYGALARHNQVLSWFQIKRTNLPLALNFRSEVKRELRRSLGENDVVLSIGAIVDSLPVIGLRGRFKFICWLRSLASGEIAARHGRLGGSLAAAIERRALQRADLIINNGEDTRAWYVVHYPAQAAKMVVIPNAVPTENLLNVPSPNLTQRPIKIAYIGRLTASKGLLCYLESVKLTDPSKPFEFHVWGGGPLDAEVHASRCIYHGPAAREDIPKVLGECHAVVHLGIVGKGIASGVSHALLEGLAAGRIIIAFRNNAYTQVVGEDEAIFVEEDNAADLAKAYELLASMSVERAFTLSAKGREIAERYSLEAHVAKFIAAIGRLGGVGSGT